MNQSQRVDNNAPQHNEESSEDIYGGCFFSFIFLFYGGRGDSPFKIRLLLFYLRQRNEMKLTSSFLNFFQSTLRLKGNALNLKTTISFLS